MTRKIALISLGCPKNLVDSENIVSDMLSRGLEMVVDPAEAQVVLVNTCGFLGSAREESIASIREVARLKEAGLEALFVTGCMVGHYADQIHEAVPEVDRLVDFKDYDRLGELVEEVLPAAAGTFAAPGRAIQARLTPAHFAYLKISEGCNHTCSFCVIPTIRGRMKSFPMEDLVARASRLVAIGAKELNLVAQDSTVYGKDLYGEVRLHELMSRLGELEGLRWLRLLYAYPTEVDDRLIDLLSEAPGAILPWLDVPIQHSSDAMLKAMHRNSSEDQVESMMSRLKQAGVTVRTTVIVGFPGESEEDFEHLLDFVRRHRIERLGAFVYSPEEGSAANELANRVDQELARERHEKLMLAQQEIAAENNRSLIGSKVEILIDDAADDQGKARGRTWRDAPEVDGAAVIRGGTPRPGEVLRCRVTAADAYDLEVEAL